MANYLVPLANHKMVRLMPSYQEVFVKRQRTNNIIKKCQ